MVRYRIKPGRADENESYIRRVFKQLERQQPAGIQYAVLRLEDGQSFVHLASTDDADGRNPLTELAAFKEFSAGIPERCEEQPVTAKVREIGRYPEIPSQAQGRLFAALRMT
jgi:hypothetical protein